MSDFVSAYFEYQEAEEKRLQESSGKPWVEWKGIYAWERAADITDREVYRSSSLTDGAAIDAHTPAGFKLAEEWSTGYRMVWTSNLTERVILTYCEGDLSYEVCPDKDAYKRALIEAGKFYKEH